MSNVTAKLAERLRAACHKLRTTSMPLADLIPVMQQAADALAAYEQAQQATAEVLRTTFERAFMAYYTNGAHLLERFDTGHYRSEEARAAWRIAMEFRSRLARAEAQAEPIPADAIAVNLMRLAGLDKHKARECEAVVRAMLEAKP